MVDNEQVLDSAERESLAILAKPIPQARFGSGRNIRAEQQELLRQQQTARENLEIIRRERERLAEEARQRSLQQQRVQEAEQQFETVRRGSTARGGGLIKEEQVKEGKAFTKLITDLRRQGITPRFDSSGNIISFEVTTLEGYKATVDPNDLPPEIVQRLNKAGIQTTSSQPTQEPVEEITTTVTPPQTVIGYRGKVQPDGTAQRISIVTTAPTQIKIPSRPIEMEETPKNPITKFIKEGAFEVTRFYKKIVGIEEKAPNVFLPTEYKKATGERDYYSKEQAALEKEFIKNLLPPLAQGIKVEPIYNSASIQAGSSLYPQNSTTQDFKQSTSGSLKTYLKETGASLGEGVVGFGKGSIRAIGELNTGGSPFAKGSRFAVLKRTPQEQEAFLQKVSFGGTKQQELAANIVVATSLLPIDPGTKIGVAYNFNNIIKINDLANNPNLIPSLRRGAVEKETRDVMSAEKQLQSFQPLISNNEFTGTPQQFKAYTESYQNYQVQQKELEGVKALRTSVKEQAFEIGTQGIVGVGFGLASAFLRGASKPIAAGVVAESTKLTAGRVGAIAVDAYFKSQIIGQGIDLSKDIRTKNIENIKIRTSGIAGSFAGFYGGSALGNYLTAPIAVKIDPVTKPAYKTEAAILQTIRGDKSVTTAQIVVRSNTPERFGLFAKRYEVLGARLSGALPSKGQLGSLSLTDIQVRLPSSKILSIQPARTSVALSEPFVISKQGTIAGSLRGTSGVRLDVQKTTTRQGGTTRTSPTIVARLEGTLYTPEQLYGTLNRKGLSKSSLRAFEEVEIAQRGTPIQGVIVKNGTPFIIKKTGAASNILLDIPANQKIVFGGVVVTKVGRLNKAGTLTAFTESRSRISRADLAFLQKEVGKVNYEQEFGLKEISALRERIGAVDVSRPSFVKPRSAILLKGSTEVRIVELPPKGEPSNFIQGIRPTPEQRFAKQQAFGISPQVQTAQLSQQQLATLKINVPKVQAGAALLVKQQLRSAPQQIKFGSAQSGAYAGLGLYERTQAVSSTRLSFANFAIARPRAFEIPQEKISLLPGQIPRSTPREIPRELAREAPREIVREIPGSILREIQRESLRQIPRQITRPAERTPTPFRTSIRPPARVARSASPFIRFPKQNQPTQPKGGSISVLLRRRGKFKPIGTGLSPSQASLLGRRSADITLGRTVRFTGVKSELSQIKIDRSFFRTPKSQSSLRAPFTFIEITPRALSTRGELFEIQSARKRKGGIL